MTASIDTPTVGLGELDCAVLEDGTRVLSERAVHRAFGSKRGGSHWQRAKRTDGANLPSYLSANNLSSFVNKDLAMAPTSPIYCTHSDVKGMGLVAAQFAPTVIDVYGEIIKGAPHHFDEVARTLREVV